ncbi:MAG: hypothetical protein CMG69_02190 [Candidatus Marinimicrobia bacterium]|nr:hypothetical protein [Candidatus Neomarinimicrobiota bacterium]|tara:strand:+ start:91553 stop:92512 length:960 start_codon:yes stop_codon:yes gene_type:complete
MSQIVEKRVNKKDELIEVLQSLMLKATTLHHYSHPQYHPIVVVNSLKNILGDVRGNPSQSLIKFGEEYLNGIPIRKRDKNMLSKIRAAGVSTSVFVMDLEDAILEKNFKNAEREAAKLFILADSPQAILESIINIALYDFEKYGVFTYHLLRAFSFGNYSNEETWTFIQCLLKQVKQVNFTKGRQNISVNFNNYFEDVLSSKKMISLNMFNSALRLYHSNYVRTSNFKQSISKWISEKDWANNNRYKNVHIPKRLILYRTSGGSYFVEKAERIIKRELNHKNTGKKLVYIDSLRMMSRDIPEHFLGFVKNRIDVIERVP